MVGQYFHRYGIVGHGRGISEVIRRIDLVSATRSTVLITGETGTGKELVARAVHHRSVQRDMPFINVNCAAIPRTAGVAWLASARTSNGSNARRFTGRSKCRPLREPTSPSRADADD
jgi:DNA-binding NtrC family response regulator